MARGAGTGSMVSFLDEGISMTYFKLYLCCRCSGPVNGLWWFG